MTKENRFKGLMGAVSKNKNVQTPENLDVQTSSTQKKVSSRDTLGAPLHGTAVSSRTDVESSKNSNVQTSDNLDNQTSKAKSSNPDYTRTTLYLPKKMHKKLKAIAVEEEREMSQIVEELLSAYLESK